MVEVLACSLVVTVGGWMQVMDGRSAVDLCVCGKGNSLLDGHTSVWGYCHINEVSVKQAVAPISVVAVSDANASNSLSQDVVARCLITV
jgi:hypothetical protein